MNAEKVVSLRLTPRQLWDLAYVREAHGWHDMKPAQVLKAILALHVEDTKRQNPEVAREWRYPA